MAYPEKILARDEEVVEHLHPHWITLVPAVFWLVVICALAGVGIAYAPSHGTGHTVTLIAIVVVGIVLLAWLAVSPWIRWRTTHYVFTTHRLLLRRGVLRRTGRDIALQRISDVGFSQSLWDRIVGSGTLTIESSGEQGQELLTNVPDSDKQQQLLNHLIEQDSDRRARSAMSGLQGYPPAGGLPQQGYPAQQPYPLQQPYPPQQPYPAAEPPQGYPTQQYPPQ